jgi:hypothetical protein
MYSVVYLEYYKHHESYTIYSHEWLNFVCYRQFCLMMGNWVFKILNQSSAICEIVKTIQRFISTYGITKAFLSFL